MAQTASGKDPLLLNKVAGAVLGTLLLLMGLNLGAEAIFRAPKPAIQGYDLPSAPEGVQTASAPVEAAPIAERLAKADPARGERVSRQCISCHSLKADGTGAQTGPRLFGIFERAKAATSFASYSAPLKARAGEKWGAEELDKFLANPRGYLPGTTMTFNGVANPDQRAELIAFLQTLK